MEDVASIAAAALQTEKTASAEEGELSPLVFPVAVSETDHPFRLAIPEKTAVTDSSGSVKISHKRSCSDTATVLDRFKTAPTSPRPDEDAVTTLRRPSSKEEGSTASNNNKTLGVTFAKKMPRPHHGSGNNLLDARRRYSGGYSGGSSSAGSSVNATWTPTTTPAATSSRVRVYRSSMAPEKYTTRDIAALDFLLGIPLEAEESIVQHGWLLQQRRKQTYHVGDDDSEGSADEDMDDTTRRHEEVLEPPGKPATTAQLASNPSHHGRWWEKWVPQANNNNNAIRKSASASPTSTSKRVKDDGELELPTASHMTLPDGTPTTLGTAQSNNTNETKRPTTNNNMPSIPAAPVYAPGRRLEGDEAILVQVPLKIDTVTRQRSIARQAAIREWEIKVAHGLTGMDSQRQIANTTPQSSNSHSQQALLDGRLFLSAAGSYPLGVFSLKRYEPKREEAALRRQKLEARGGGGSHFVMPSRDWRGISYRALLPRKAEQTRNQKAFNRFLRKNRPARKSKRTEHLDDSDKDLHDLHMASSEEDNNRSEKNNNDDESDSDDTLSSSSSSSSSEDSYIPGILDDPEMTLGRHRNVMIGDCVTGCIVSSTIQFVKPALLKADLNQKFRERFDGWEPGKSQRKYIGARVVDGRYKLIDPTESTQDDATANAGSASDQNHHEPPNTPSNATPAIIRMPPSLTLSKIRSIKRQALLAFVKADLEVGTVALACVYFERLCLSCRVDKSNRRLCFASCLLLACKINEPSEVLVIREDDANTSGAESGDDEDKRHTNTRKKIKRLQSSIRPNQRSSSMFASLLEFFTQYWSLSLKHLFAAEWGVFAALRFSLHATPSQVAFHFKRLMKTLEWTPRRYLGAEMYAQWQDALATEERNVLARDKRREVRQVRKERRLQRELQKEVIRGKQLVGRKSSTKGKSSAIVFQQDSEPSEKGGPGMKIAVKKKAGGVDAKRAGGNNNGNGTPPGGESSQSDDLLGGRVRNPPKSKSGQQFYLSAMARSPHVSPKKERLIEAPPNTPTAGAAIRKPRQISLLTRLGMRRPSSSDKLVELGSLSHSAREGQQRERDRAGLGLPLSPSMPMIALGGSLSDLQSDGQEPLNYSTATNMNDSVSGTNLNDSVFIDMPPDSPRGDDAGNRGGNSGDEEKGMIDENEMGIVI